LSILVACIGNIFQGDDAFGCEVAKVLTKRPPPNGVRIVDFGIRGLDLAYALLDAPDSGGRGLSRRGAGYAVYN
jgi:hydrogenase maturation protease